MKKTILVVEDEKPLLDAIKIKLEKNGFNVLTARSVEQAKNHILDVGKIDCVWLDHYLLGKESGLDLIFWCKEGTKDHRKMPIFVVSNTASEKKIQTYMRLGVNKYYVKAEKRLEEIIKGIKDSLENEKG